MKSIEKLSKIITWPMVAVLAIGAAAFVAVVLFAEGETRTLLIGADGLVASLVAYWLRSPRDRELIASLPPPPDPTTTPETPSSKRNAGFSTLDAMVAALVVGGLVALVSAWAGCGASDAVRARYSVEVAHCIANERAIVDRVGTTREQDLADLEAERARCDAALAAIEGGE